MRGMLVGIFLLSSALAKAVPELSIVANPDLPPYSSEKLVGGGLVVTILKAAMAKEGIKFNIKWLPWKRGCDEVKRGLHSGAFPTPLSEEIKSDFFVSEPIYTLDEVLFASSKNNFKDEKEFKGKSICRPKDWSNNIDIDAFVKRHNLRVEHGTGPNGCIKMLLSERADFFVSDEIQASMAISEVIDENKAMYEKLPQIISLGKKISTTSLYFVAPKSSNESRSLVKKINSQISKMNKDGSIRKIIQDYRG